jgi:glycosyltransferase involved in cell wall biosynthesis
MFGWELPPYNSGGLGTACLGLTEGLSFLGIDIDFVIPKAFGSFPFNHMSIHSASDYSSIKDVERLFKFSKKDQDSLTRLIAYNPNFKFDLKKRRLLLKKVRQGVGSVPLTPKIQSKWYAEQAKSIADQHDFDVVHCHDWMTYYAGITAKQVAAAKGRAVPFIAHVHATEMDRSGENGDPEIISIEKEGLKAADRVVTVSHYTKQIVHKHYGIPLNKISVVHNGIPLHKAPDLYNDLKALKRKHKIVLFMGRLTMQKGPDYFLKLAKAVTDIDPSVRFILVGSGDMRERCIEEAAQSGLTGKILFSSFLRGKDVDRAYQLADLFVMPSVSEPFGIVALEAMQNGTPVLASKQSGVIEVTNNIVSIDFWDIDAMRNAVLNLLKDPNYRNHLITEGRNDLYHLTWQQSAQVMKNIYQEVYNSFQKQNQLAREVVTSI